MVDFFGSPRSGAPTVQSGTLPAPIKGINSVMGLVGMESTDAIITVNIDASPYGCVVRPGYVEYTNGFTGDQAKTIIPFTGSADDGANDKFFATTNDGVFDITDIATTPLKVFNYLTKTSTAGWGIFTQVVNDNGDHALLLTDSENGVLQYLESTGLWGIPDITGPTGTLVFVTKWKERVWYIEENSTSAWYTDPGSFSGALTEFNFGNKFRAGGNLVALYSWTLDAGDGSDDYLVAVSSAGDVVVYSGTDPNSSSTFGQIGRWFIGALPAGRRVGSQFGGDLLLLSSYGLISAGDLLAGNNPFTEKGSLSWKIQGFLSTLMSETRTTLGWEVKLHPALNIIMISTPKVINKPFRQFVYNTNVEGWSIWEDVPILTSESFKGKTYIASPNPSSVWYMSGYLDNVRLTPQEQAGIFLFEYTYIGVNTFSVGDRIQGQTSGATATIYSVGATYLGVAAVLGAFVAGEEIRNVSSNLPIMVSVGSGNKAMYGKLGDNFTLATVPANSGRNWVAAAYSPELGRVVAVGFNGTGSCVMYSDDGGQTWTASTETTGITQWASITWSPTLNLFCATAIGGGTATTRIGTSPDGNVWTLRTHPVIPGGNSWGPVIWSVLFNKFYAAASSGFAAGTIKTSPDGITWTDMSGTQTNNGVTWWCESDTRLYHGGTGDTQTWNTTTGTSFTAAGSIAGGTKEGAIHPTSNLACMTPGTAANVYKTTNNSMSSQSTSVVDGRVWDDVVYATILEKFFCVNRVASGGDPVFSTTDVDTFSFPTADTATKSVSWEEIIEAEYPDYAGATLVSISVNPADGLPTEIEWRGLTAYSSLGADEKMKRVSFIRPVFISDTAPTFSAVAKYEYDLEELDDFLNLQTIGGSLWDQALWDTATWDGSPESRLLPPRGGSGMGRMVAISWAGKSHAKTILASFGVMFDSGGMM